MAIELHNTLYAVSGGTIDGLATEASARAWLAAVRDRLPPVGAGRVAREELISLRDAVGAALQAILDGRSPTRDDLAAINGTGARAPRSPVAQWRRDGLPVRATSFHGSEPADIVLAAIAADAIDLIATSRRDALRACGAPGCILLFVKDHPRREWCSQACGNRARQARHYARIRQTAEMPAMPPRSSNR
ncbi:MAG: CGNR zinc finger domain-containing protein [Solirubrobacteraceae bacterium]